jgi:hypothetical protein
MAPTWAVAFLSELSLSTVPIGPGGVQDPILPHGSFRNINLYVHQNSPKLPTFILKMQAAYTSELLTALPKSMWSKYTEINKH